MYENYIELLKSRLDNYRFVHSLGVAKASVHLAELYGAEKQRAYLAGLLHDVTKNIPTEEQLQIIRNAGIMLSVVEQNSPKLWHAVSGSIFLRDVLNINDDGVISAVRYHTTGRARMTRLEEIVYLADFISEERSYPDVGKVRSLADQSLDEAILYTLRYTISSLSEKCVPIHPDTLDAYNCYTLKQRGETVGIF